jgi:hypothetical protein
MSKPKIFLIIIIIICIFLGYSYYNYNNRAKGIYAVEEYSKINNLTSIWHLRELHFNIFDWILGDKTQFNFILVSKKSIRINSNENYWILFTSWKDPQKQETLKNYLVNRNNEKFYIIIHDSLGLPIERDSLYEKEISETIFEVVNDWIKVENSKK